MKMSISSNYLLFVSEILEFFVVGITVSVNTPTYSMRWWLSPTAGKSNMLTIDQISMNPRTMPPISIDVGPELVSWVSSSEPTTCVETDKPCLHNTRPGNCRTNTLSSISLSYSHTIKLMNSGRTLSYCYFINFFHYLYHLYW